MGDPNRGPKVLLQGSTMAFPGAPIYSNAFVCSEMMRLSLSGGGPMNVVFSHWVPRNGDPWSHGIHFQESDILFGAQSDCDTLFYCPAAWTVVSRTTSLSHPCSDLYPCPKPNSDSAPYLQTRTPQTHPGLRLQRAALDQHSHRVSRHCPFKRRRATSLKGTQLGR